MLEATDALPQDMPEWLVIDWKETTAKLREDYSVVEFGRATYWTR
jgi:hypothetical protein